MLNLPETLKGFNVFVDGSTYGGKCTSIQLPKLSRITEDYQGAGLTGPIELDQGQDKIELSEMVIAEPSPSLLKLYGTQDINGVRIRLKGAFKAENIPLEKPLEIIMQGRWTEIDFGTWEPKKGGELKLKATLTYYKLKYAGETIYEFDFINGVEIVNGVDRLLQRRLLLERTI
ncbi:major tail tube protein [Pseudoalteromonas luteoviolacea CPMOR-1]|uniref:Major tail tube protein n=1 Tax=Pseudoalteromonas luteoviolacea CPMOR-1 TaxID=1365248 RepID=A0A161YC88_9GAMM|nr:phage major tail tube protein [Pseudoalteromonas luteoviolacea]KZN57476.1 major tail tube protein [Pseudoalteromonas luteoviolacea CPMOR-1]